jgi:hypothetical protein
VNCESRHFASKIMTKNSMPGFLTKLLLLKSTNFSAFIFNTKKTGC